MRDISTAVSNAVDLSRLAPLAAVKMSISRDVSQDLYIWDGNGNQTFDNQTWVGVGSLGTISDISETSTTEASKVQLTLSGFVAGQLITFRRSQFQGKEVIIYFGVRNIDTFDIEGMDIHWRGFIDTIDIVNQGSKIIVTCESKMLLLDEPNISHYTDAEQQMRHTGDDSFKHVSQIEVLMEEVRW